MAHPVEQASFPVAMLDAHINKANNHVSVCTSKLS